MSQVSKQIAKFKVETSFNITGRGIMALGTFTEGMAKLGAIANVVVNDKSTPVTIAGMEWGKPDDQGFIKCGLRLRFVDDECRMLVEQNRLQPQEIVIHDPLT
jgi:translation elongation factor EF-Tu-like GTPase